MSNIYNISTLEFYNYGESNKMESKYTSSYKVKVSDKDGNIITIENDGGLYAMVSLNFNSSTGILELLDVAHDNSVLAEVEMPNADYIYNCRFDEATNSILFDVKSLYGDKTDTIELDVESLVEIYEAGQGIEIGEANNATGKKPISIKLVEGENLLQLSDDGLSLDDKVVTRDELEAAISGKADYSYVNELYTGISGLTSGVTDIYNQLFKHEDDINKLQRIVGTDQEVPSLYEQIETNVEDIAELDAELGELSGNITTINDELNEINDDITSLNGNLTSLEDEVQKNKVKIELITDGLEENVKEAYILTNNDGVQLGEAIKIYSNSSLIDIEYATIDDRGIEGKYLKITYELEDGSLKVVYVDLSDLIVNTNFADGLTVERDTVKVKIDVNSDNYISVSENGILLSGVSSSIEELTDINQHQWDSINNNYFELSGLIEEEAIARQSFDNGLQANIDIETENRISDVEALNAAISAETRNRINGDAEVSANINSKVLEEKSRAMVKEAELSGSILNESNRAISAENSINSRIDDEINERETGDNSIRQFVNDKVNTIEGSIDTVNLLLNEEINERQLKDDEIEENIGFIADNYGTKEYIDNNDNNVKEEVLNISSSYTKTYVDDNIDGLEASFKHYCDSGHTELQNEINKTATKVNVISNLIGVNGSDASNYDDNGNGILDVLHKEFHQLINGVSASQLSGLLTDMLRRIEALENA